MNIKICDICGSEIPSTATVRACQGDHYLSGSVVDNKSGRNLNVEITIPVHDIPDICDRCFIETVDTVLSLHNDILRSNDKKKKLITRPHGPAGLML